MPDARLAIESLSAAIDGAAAWADARLAVKAAGYPSIRAAYRRVLDEQLYDFGTSAKGTRVTAYQNAVRQAAVESFEAAFARGYAETSGGGSYADDQDAGDWINARTEAELGYIGEMFQSLKQLRDQVWAKEARTGEIKDFVGARKEGYSASLDSVNSAGKMWGIKNQALEWELGQTEVHCTTCAKLDGTSHRAKWYIAHDYIPRKPGCELECKGYKCDCRLKNRATGEYVTI